MRIATYNVNGVNGRLPRVLDWLRETAPDIVCLQEIKTKDHDYKLAWFDRLIAHAQTLIDSGRPAVLAGDFNVVPTNDDIYNAWAWREDAVMQPQTRAATPVSAWISCW